LIVAQPLCNKVSAISTAASLEIFPNVIADLLAIQNSSMTWFSPASRVSIRDWRYLLAVTPYSSEQDLREQQRYADFVLSS
jgi:hypothetical protein